MMIRRKGRGKGQLSGRWFSPILIFAFFFSVLMACHTAGDKENKGAAGQANPATGPFLLEANVDFPDDALGSPVALTPTHLDAMMQRLKEIGVRRVSWDYYGDGHGGFLIPTGYDGGEGANWGVFGATYRGLGNPLKVAVEAGHRHGIEVYAYFKPYETGASMLFPEGSPQAKTMGQLPQIGGRMGWLDPFVKAHPELRIKRRTDDLPPGVGQAVVTSLRLIKKDDSPTRITKEHLQIWSSNANWQYQREKVDFAFSDAVEKAPRPVHDQRGNVLTAAGQPVRVLTLSGLKLTDKYILITTDFTDGHPDFVNAGTALVEALDARGRVIPAVVASGATVWCPELQNFRTAGLNFDYGWGSTPVALDAPNASGNKGLIAFARGRNLYLPGALCETEPQVRKFWMMCLEEMIAAGVDGVDFRDENHSTHTDYPEDYGFNEAVLKQCNGLKGEALMAKIAEVRGQAYTDFLRQCKQRLAAAGKRMRYNLQMDWLRPNRPPDRALAYPANLNWEWEKWIDEKLMDEAIFRFDHMQHAEALADPVSREIVERCQRNAIPVTFNQYLDSNGYLSPGARGSSVPGQIKDVRADGRFSGFILYETSTFLHFDAQGHCLNDWPILETLGPLLGP
jgi:hypothetical protein